MREVLSIFQIENLFLFQTVAKNAIHYNLDVRADHFDTLSHPSDNPRTDFHHSVAQCSSSTSAGPNHLLTKMQ
jgi:hypothetical protein